MADLSGETGLRLTQDLLLGGRLCLWQPREGYRAAIDPVLLAASIEASPSQIILDVGCGVGTAALCLATRLQGIRLVGIEIRTEMVRLAQANAESNGFAGRASFLAGDIHTPPQELIPNSFDQVMANPPFGVLGRGEIPPDSSKAHANVEDSEGFSAWLHFGLRMLRPKGRITFVHRADRLDEILATMQGKVGEIVVFPLWPGPLSASGVSVAAAKRLIIRARKGVRTSLRLAPGLVLHGPDGAFTPEAEAVLRHGEALSL